MKRALLVIFIVFSLPISTADAAVMKSTKSVIDLPYLKSDEISDIALTSNNIILSGTTESPNSSWINGPLGGLSDAFIASYSPSGTQIWNLRLGSITNEIATSLFVDVDGSIWIVGAGTSIITPTPAATVGNLLNPDNVEIEALQNRNSPLNRIKLWQVSSSGSLLNAFEYISEDIINPKKILSSGN
ncbi:MAG: hypothetical protein RIS93_612, partial [Actinomycetota bacterium]